MANRFTTHVLKHSDIVDRPLPSSLLKGEPIINTAQGIMYFSGVTTSTPQWTSGSTNPTFFEVGSNLEVLKIRNRIISYSGVTDLTGQFLSGTTNGFVLAPVSSITGVDTYVTNFSYNDSNVLSLTQNQSGQNFNVLINQMSGLTVNGTLSATTLNGNSGTITTNATNPTDIVNYRTLTGFSSTSDTYVTGGTITQQPSNTSISGTVQLSYNKTVGGAYTLPYTDVFITGFTYDSSTNKFTISDNSGNTFNKEFTTVSGLTVDNLVAGQVVYAGSNKELKSDSDFTFDDNQNKLIVTNLSVNNTASAATFGTGGVVIGSNGNYGTPGTGDLTVHGSLTVFGPSISAFTSELYIEDSNIILNYNPTGSSQSTSIGAGFKIQDGQGSSNEDVSLQIVGLYNLTGNTGDPSPIVPYTTEYNISNDGRANRGWITELNDIVIRSSDISTPKGARVLAEFDVLDGGTY